jgi:hypothetical protein
MVRGALAIVVSFSVSAIAGTAGIHPRIVEVMSEDGVRTLQHPARVAAFEVQLVHELPEDGGDAARLRAGGLPVVRVGRVLAIDAAQELGAMLLDPALYDRRQVPPTGTGELVTRLCGFQPKWVLRFSPANEASSRPLDVLLTDHCDELAAVVGSLKTTGKAPDSRSAIHAALMARPRLMTDPGRVSLLRGLLRFFPDDPELVRELAEARKVDAELGRAIAAVTPELRTALDAYRPEAGVSWTELTPRRAGLHRLKLPSDHALVALFRVEGELSSGSKTRFPGTAALGALLASIDRSTLERVFARLDEDRVARVGAACAYFETELWAEYPEEVRAEATRRFAEVLLLDGSPEQQALLNDVPGGFSASGRR